MLHSSGGGVLTLKRKARITCGCFHEEFLIDRNPRFKEHGINEGCECDERALVNQVHRFAVFARSLAVFLRFRSSSLFPCVFVTVVWLLENRCWGKVSQAYRSWCVRSVSQFQIQTHIVQELCESRGGRPGLSVLTNLLVSVDVKLY